MAISRFEVRHDVLYAGVVLQAVHREVFAVAGVLEATVGHLRDERDVGVDPHAPEVEPPAYPHRPAVVRGEDAGGEAVLDAVGPPHRLVLVREGLDGYDGAEDLVLGCFVILPETRDHGGGVEEPLLTEPFAADGYLGVVGEPVYHARDVLELGGVVERAVIHLVVRVARRRVPGLFRDRGDEVVVDAWVGEHAGGRGAVLARVEVAGARDLLGSRLDVGVVEDDDRRLAAELQVYPLEVGGGGLRDLHAGPYGTGDRDHLRRGVLDQHPPRVPITADHVEDAFGEELRGDLGHHHSGDGGGVGGLDHDGVTRGYGRGELPDRHHHRVVPRRYLADDAHGLAADERRVPSEILPCRLPFEDAGRAGEEADLIHPRRDLLFHGEPEGLPRVLGLRPHQVLGPVFYGVGQLQERELPLRGGRVAPRLEGLCRRIECPVDVFLLRIGRLCERLAGGRVDQVVGAAVSGVYVLAPHEVLQCFRLRHLSSLSLALPVLYFLRRSAMPPRISLMILSAASALMSADPTPVGITSTISAPITSSCVATCRTAQSSSAVVIPPGSGVPVPGAKAGSRTSMSTVRKTGPAPTASTARRMTSFMPRSLTSCMNRLVIPCSDCQANSASPGQ